MRGIPKQREIELPILEYVADRTKYGFGDIYAAMVRRFRLTTEEEQEPMPYARGVTDGPPSGKNVFYKNCNNACRALMKKGYLEGQGQRYEAKCYRITERGLSKLRRHGGGL